LGLKHRFTRPYTPRTNGKTERFIQTALREWAYARAYHRSANYRASWMATTGIALTPAWQTNRPHPHLDSRGTTS